MSNLLEQASLVLIPSGYKEDVVYSEIPLDGSGDMVFSRSSNGTRVNSAGLVEVCPWNLVQQSETFDNASWAKNTGGTSTVTVTANSGIAPNGTTTADRIQLTRDSLGFAQVIQTVTTTTSQSYTFSVYLKSLSGTPTVMFGSFGGTNTQTATLTNEWVRYTWTATSPSTSAFALLMIWGGVGSTSLSADFLAWGYQLVEGSSAKPYFPTTDRLNVPRLTYQNGGGGCPSLLLEKQSTNLVSYSQDFSNAYWSKLGQGVGSTSVVTANYAISPDGTQNATRFVCNLNGGTTSSDRSWMIASFTAQATSTVSIWIKLNSAGTKTVLLSDSGGGTKTISGTDWQRIDATFVGASGEFRIGLIGGTTSDTLDCCIWGAQAEAGSYPTSYIPTTSASATRVIDEITPKSLSSVGITANYTLYFQLGQCNMSAAESWILQASSGANTPFQIYGTTAILYTSTGYLYPFSFLSTNPNNNKVAVSYDGTNIKVFWNGAKMGQWTATSEWANLTTLDLAYGISTQIQYKEVVLFNVGLSDADGISLTTI